MIKRRASRDKLKRPRLPCGGRFHFRSIRIMDDLTRTVIERGDLAHLALFLWASGASALLVWALREMAKVNQHFNDFVQEIASLNRLFRKDD
jgi:hypothetical protein